MTLTFTLRIEADAPGIDVSKGERQDFDDAVMRVAVEALERHSVASAKTRLCHAEILRIDNHVGDRIERADLDHS